MDQDLHTLDSQSNLAFAFLNSVKGRIVVRASSWKSLRIASIQLLVERAFGLRSSHDIPKALPG